MEGKKLDVAIKAQVSFESISSCLCSAFEGGSNYWYMIESQKKPKNFDNSTDFEKRFPHISYPVNSGGELMISCEKLGDEAAAEHRGPGGKGFKKFRLNLESIAKGLALMAENHPRHFAQLSDEDGGDAETGDVLLQLCLFGEVVYG